jgi:3-hydroxyisobutyrate dehydrogenase
MTAIGFIGLGNMGLPMSLNLIKAGHQVTGFDLNADAVQSFAAAGGHVAADAASAAQAGEVVITMLPAGAQVRQVYSEAILPSVKDALLIDCSTIDVDTAREVAAMAAAAGMEMLDAPVSGGTGGAEAGTLTFMVGGSDASFAAAKPYFEIMGATIVHTGGVGNGQAAKICNNMILAISMIGVAEAFTMGERLGVDAQTLFDITSTSSGQCWAINTYCPVPGPVPGSPANRDFKAGFTAAMMLKDLRLSQDAAKSSDTASPLGSEAEKLFSEFVDGGNGSYDFSAIIRMIAAR